jgi:hypothetical protein
MASSAHQFMLTLVAKKMRTMGFEPIAYDGDYSQIGTHKLNIPPTIKHHRPDVVGINEKEEFCIGEVKTEDDILSQRSKNQFVDFAENGHLIIGIPRNGKQSLCNELKKLNLLFNMNVTLVTVPEELIPYDTEDI